MANCRRTSFAFIWILVIFMLHAINLACASSRQDQIARNGASDFQLGDIYGLPLIYVHGFCGDPTDWVPLENAIFNNLYSAYPALYQNGEMLYVYYQASNLSPTTGPVWFQDQRDPPDFFQSIDSSHRLFSLAFYDGVSSDARHFDSAKVANISISQKADELAHVIWRVKQVTGSPRVVVIAHSLGGLVARTYMEGLATSNSGDIDPYANDIALLITLDTPNNGAPSANWNIDPFNLTCFSGASVNKAEMIPPNDGGNFIPNLNRSQFTSKVTVEATHFASFVTAGAGMSSDDIVPIDSQDITSTLGTTYSGVLAARTNLLDDIDVQSHQVDCYWKSLIRVVHFLPCLLDQNAIITQIQDIVLHPVQLHQALVAIPTSESVQVGSTDTVPFSATFQGSPIDVVWSMLEGFSGGSISGDGKYTAPSLPGTYHAVAIRTSNPNEIGVVTINVFNPPSLNGPFLEAPSDQAINQSTSPIMQWSSVADATGYRLMLASDPSFLPQDPAARTCSNCLVNLTTTTTSLRAPGNTLVPNTTYYWQVKAFEDSLDGPWSKIFRFSTAPAGASLSIVTNALPDAQQGLTYQFQLDASGGTAPYTWTSFPSPPFPGFTLSADGNLIGSSAQLGTFVFTAEVKDSKGNIADKNLQLTVDALPATDFQLDILGNSAQSVAAGEAANFTITATDITGPSQTISLSVVSGNPSNAVLSFNPSAITTGNQAVLSISISTSTPVGDYLLTIQGTNGTLTHTIQVKLTVTPAVVNLPQIKSLTLSANSVVTGAVVTGTVSLANAVSSDVLVAIQSDMTSVAQPQPANVVIPAGSLSATFNVNTFNVTQSSTATLSVTNTGLTAQLTVTPYIYPGFSFTINPHYQTVPPGIAAIYTIQTATTQGASPQTLTFELLSVPPGASFSFNPPTVTSGSTTTLTISN